MCVCVRACVCINVQCSLILGRVGYCKVCLTMKRAFENSTDTQLCIAKAVFSQMHSEISKKNTSGT